MNSKCKGIILAVLMVFVLVSGARAELSWNALSLKIFGGPSQNGGRTSDEGWEHEYEMGLSGTMVISDKYELELAFSKWDVQSRKVENYWEDRANKFSLTGRRKYFFPSLFVPWWEVGADMALIDTYKRETEEPENNNEHEKEYSLTALGGHIGCGVDIYPVEYSSLAFTIDFRYTGYVVSDDINGPEIFFGIRYDFFQRGLDRRNYKRVDQGDYKPIQETPVWLR